MDNDNPVKELINEQLASDINEILETVEAGVESFGKHTKDLNNPHQVTKEQVGLGNVDNTSDMDKPISNAVASAIKTLETGMGLAVQGVMSAIHTHIQENEADHQKITQTTNNMINQVNENIATVVGQINENIGVIVGELNSQILGTQSAVETLDNKVDSAVNTINGDIAQVKSSVETFKQEIDSAIQTLEHEFDSDLETAKQEILEVVDGFKVNLDLVATSVETLKSQTQSAIETNKTEVLNTVSGIKTSLQSAIETHNHDERYIKKTDVSESGFAAADHNHDDTYSKTNHKHTEYAAASHSHIHNHDELYSKINHSHSGLAVNNVSRGGSVVNMEFAGALGSCVNAGLTWNYNADNGEFYINLATDNADVGASIIITPNKQIRIAYLRK